MATSFHKSLPPFSFGLKEKIHFPPFAFAGCSHMGLMPFLNICRLESISSDEGLCMRLKKRQKVSMVETWPNPCNRCSNCSAPALALDLHWVVLSNQNSQECSKT
eukprot:Lithocolla_globosa_v1_NODE_5882_length_1170_cov_12.260090.p3 type:complete len:105 gc:universal NODE_5882_length_1170_cov_12.260090:307-621(+)